MKRQSSLLIAALLLGTAACGGAPEKPPEPAEADEPSTPGNSEQPDADPADPAAAEAPEPGRTVASGLDLGQGFKAFDIINCDTGDQYCQVCKFGPSPKIMAVGTIDDEAFHKDLQDLDAIVAKYGDDKVKVFAVVADAKDGALVTPTGDNDQLLAEAKALRAKLDIDMPVVIPAPKDAGPNGTFEDHYQVTKSRTIMFSTGDNEVKYSEIAPEDFASLDEAIKAAIG